MFSVHQKRAIADAVQGILRATHHPELPVQGEVQFKLHVDGAHPSSWADIQNNGSVTNPGVNPHNELMAAITAGSHRWNLEHLPDGSIRICEGDHHRSADCEWVHYVRADSVQTSEAWAAERERVIKTLEMHGVSKERMRGHPSTGIEVLVNRMDKDVAFLRAERDQLREGLGNLLTAIDNWRKMSPLYGAGGGDDSVGTPTQQAGA
jgi:hypothetical protein